MSPLKRDFVTEYFIILAKLDFRQQFLEWYLRVKVDRETEEGEEKAQEIIDSLEASQKMVEHLLMFILEGDKAKYELLKKPKKRSLNRNNTVNT